MKVNCAILATTISALLLFLVMFPAHDRDSICGLYTFLESIVRVLYGGERVEEERAVFVTKISVSFGKWKLKWYLGVMKLWLTSARMMRRHG